MQWHQNQGTWVGTETTIRTMKIMNQIESDVTGKVIKMLVDNGEAVEYGQPLFVIEQSEG